jgi:hypothetical protein
VSDGETVRIRPGRKLDADQNPVATTGSEFDIEDCVIEPIGSEESKGYGRSGTVTRIRIYTPGPVARPILATDVVEARGKAWTIEGFPDDWADEDADLSGPVITAARGIG